MKFNQFQLFVARSILYNPVMKRLFDIVVVGITSPIWGLTSIIVALLVLMRIGRPVLFVQTRIGKDNRPFKLFKFRSMRSTDEFDVAPSDESVRIPPFGHFIRNTSLDELPGLLNVLLGSMSLVGPRPLLPEYVPLYNDFQAQRHDVMPGITGWAQVNGRNAITWEQKFELDVWYKNNQSLKLDIKILVITLVKVVAKSDINTVQGSTMEAFRGSSDKQN